MFYFNEDEEMMNEGEMPEEMSDDEDGEDMAMGESDMDSDGE